MKGIILAGGLGTRLYPLTKTLSKHILPVYDKPMIYYPLSVLMITGIRDVLIISNSKDINLFKGLLGNGKHLGISINYGVQEVPNGIAEAFIIGEKFIGNSSVALILGDNVFYGKRLIKIVENRLSKKKGATIFCYSVLKPEDYGVAEFSPNGEILSIEEKPIHPKSNYAITGLYFYDNNVVEISKQIAPSSRGELEISTVNNVYLSNGQLEAVILKKGIVWFDTGTFLELNKASNSIKKIQKQYDVYISCIEEIAYQKGFINAFQLEKIISSLMNSEYKQYLRKLLTY